MLDKEQLDENVEFIDSIIDQSINQTIKEDPKKKGAIQIDVNNSGQFNLKVYRGTEVEPTVIEDITKDELISALEQKL